MAFARFPRQWFQIISQRLLVDFGVGGGDKTLEQRVRLVRFALEFRVKLARDEEWMAGEFDDLDELAVGREAAENETGLLEFVAVAVVEIS